MFVRPYGDQRWDGIVRGTGLLAAIGIPLVLVVPAAAPLLVFVLATLWTHGPLAMLMPAAYEPILAHFGGLYPPFQIAVIGTLADLVVEYVDYHVFAALCRGKLARHTVERGIVQRAIRWFNRAPFLTTFVFALTPLPDWALRLVAPAAGYSVPRYLLAMGLGRLPNFWLFAAAGHRWRPSGSVIVGLLCVSICLGVIAVRRQRRAT
jgi:hypothetical protein